ncbi:MAG: phage tail sheath C-terminal domain-containing protein, partial [Bacteroidota bacterium]
FGSGYYPWVNTTIVQADEISYQNLSNPKVLQDILDREAQLAVFGKLLGGGGGSTSSKSSGGGKTPPPKPKAPASDPDPKLVKKYEAFKAEFDKITDSDADPVSVQQTLTAISPTFKDVMKNIRDTWNVMPPSAAMAGVYSLVDNTAGVHKAPANVSLSAVVSPTVNLTSENQEDLNMPLNGKAVNAIRSFVGKGVLVWGARTLDGNSQDWRYISVRRTVIMLEQSIKNSVEAYVFEANNSQTWLRVRTSIQNFLTDMWKAGSLAGSSTAEAYDVQVGLGTTMTPVDILEGVMKITVKVAVTRPAEFIVITFQQKMQES